MSEQESFTLAMMRTWSWLLLAIMLACPSGVLAQDDPNSIEAHSRVASEAEQQHDYARAASEWKAIVQLSPELAEAHSNLGMMYHLEHQPEAAISSFKTALRLKPELASARLFLGIDYYVTSRPDLAVEQLRQVVSQTPNDPLARKWLGLSYLYVGNPQRAVAELQRARRSDPDDEELAFHLSRAYLMLFVHAFDAVGSTAPDSPWDHLIKGEQFEVQTRLSEALVELQKALRASGAPPGIHFRRAVIFAGQGNGSSAVEEYGNELLDRPQHLQSIVKLAGLLRNSGLNPQAEELLRLARTSLQGHPQTLTLLAQLLEQATGPTAKVGADLEDSRSAAHAFLVKYSQRIQSPERTEKWVEKVQNALDRDDFNESAQLLASPPASMETTLVQGWRAQAKMERGDFEQAVDLLLQVVAQAPGHPQYSYYLGECAEKLALSNLASLVKAAPDSYRTHQLQAEYYVAHNEDPQAIAAYTKVLSLKPTAIQIHLALARIYQSENHYDEAVTECEAELKADPYSVPAREMMGEIKFKLGQPELAKPYLLEAVKINPNSPRALLWLGKIEVAEGSYKEAVPHFRSALQAGVDDPATVYLELSRTLARMGETQEADRYMALFRQSKTQQGEKQQHRRFENP